VKALGRNAGKLAAGAVLWCLLGPIAAKANDVAEIRAIQLSIASAAEARNLDAIMSHYLPGDKLFVFDMYPPRAYLGWNAFREDWKTFLDKLKKDLSATSWAILKPPATVNLAILIWSSTSGACRWMASHSN
jgi:hypothetical protein